MLRRQVSDPIDQSAYRVGVQDATVGQVNLAGVATKVQSMNDLAAVDQLLDGDELESANANGAQRPVQP